jgi:hypothetical protein
VNGLSCGNILWQLSSSSDFDTTARAQSSVGNFYHPNPFHHVRLSPCPIMTPDGVNEHRHRIHLLDFNIALFRAIFTLLAALYTKLLYIRVQHTWVHTLRHIYPASRWHCTRALSSPSPESASTLRDPLMPPVFPVFLYDCSDVYAVCACRSYPHGRDVSPSPTSSILPNPTPTACTSSESSVTNRALVQDLLRSPGQDTLLI